MVRPSPLYTCTACVCVYVGTCVFGRASLRLPAGPDAGVCTVCKSGASWVVQA